MATIKNQINKGNNRLAVLGPLPSGVTLAFTNPSFTLFRDGTASFYLSGGSGVSIDSVTKPANPPTWLQVNNDVASVTATTTTTNSGQTTSFTSLTVSYSYGSSGHTALFWVNAHYSDIDASNLSASFTLNNDQSFEITQLASGLKVGGQSPSYLVQSGTTVSFSFFSRTSPTFDSLTWSSRPTFISASSLSTYSASFVDTSTASATANFTLRTSLGNVDDPTIVNDPDPT